MKESGFKKFEPKNIRPNQFMRPPTEPLRPPIDVGNLKLEKRINKTAKALSAQDLVIGNKEKSEPKEPQLQVASELEIFLFSKDSHPTKDVKKPDYANPNYKKAHVENVSNLVDKMRQPTAKAGLREMLNDAGKIYGRLCLEIRTLPEDVAEYNKAMEEIKNWFQTNTKLFDINPVVWSQHLHLSLVDPRTRYNLLEQKPIQSAVNKGFVDIYHRALPLLRLPENIESEDTRKIAGINNDYGVKIKGANLDDDHRLSVVGPTRVEGRMNNSDYAHDPYLNLFAHLIGLNRGLQYVTSHAKLDKGYRLQYNDSGEFFTIGNGHTTFKGSLDHLKKDDVLRKEFSKELLTNLHTIVSQYYAISTGAISLEEVRERSYDKLALPQTSSKKSKIFTLFQKHPPDNTDT